jgi:hypothetical protein
MGYQLRALVGSVAYGIQRVAGSVLSLVGLRAAARWVAPALVALLAVGAGLSARDTATILGSRPDVTEATLSDVANHDDTAASIWYSFDALVDSSSYETPADLGTFFYLATDPADPAQGLLVRSPMNDSFFRQRVVGATLVEDPDVVASALESFGTLPSGFSVDDVRYLDETSAGGDAAQAFEPSQVGDEAAGSSLLVEGRVVSPERFVATDGDANLYLFADADSGSAIVLRSPHPPDAIPVHLEGLFLRDTFDLAPVLDSEWFAAIEADVPTDRALQAGNRPPITVEASWVPTIVFGSFALLLLASVVIGYPVFAPAASPPARRTLAAGDVIDVEITGRMSRDGSTITLEASPGTLERLSVEDLALRMWRYGLLSKELSRRDAERRYVEESGVGSDRLVLHERDQSALVIVARDPGAVDVLVGRLHRVGRSAPTLHLRQGSNDTYLTAANDEERDRAAAEIAAEAAGTTA